MEIRVKGALYALSEMYKRMDEWVILSAKRYSNGGNCLRQRIRLKALALVFHDRIITDRDINGG